jgi:hypothetical protein
MSLARAIAHLRLGSQTDVRRVQSSPEPLDSDDSVKPFRLLDLPKEIRLMVYEALDVVYHRHPVPLFRTGEQGTLINPSLDGVYILQTCRLVNDEAGQIFRKALNHLSRTPATMSVDVEDLIALTSLGDYDSFHRNTLERIMTGTCGPRVQRLIQDYRIGRMSIRDLRKILHMPKYITDELLKALMSFMLRAAHVRETVPDSNAHPPLRIVIRLPASFTGPSYTTTIPLILRLYYKYIHHIRMQRSTTLLATRHRIVENFAYRTAYACGSNKRTSMSVQLHFPDSAEAYTDVASLQHSMESAIASGITLALPHEEHHVLKYEGLCDASAPW